MSTKDKLVKRRGAIKSSLTRFKSYFLAVSKDSIVSNEGIKQLECRVLNIEAAYAEFNNIQIEIECLSVDASDDAIHEHERNTFEQTYYDTLASAKEFISNKEKLNMAKVADAVATNSESQNVKLPLIQLPMYEGNYEGWSIFYETFNSLIHENRNISDIQKFHYLKSSLKKAAAQVIESLEMSASNYALAWKLLCERFDNKKLIIHNHIKSLFELPGIDKESHVKIRQLIDSVNKHLRALTSLKMPTEHWDVLVIYLITQKLDVVTMTQWANFKTNSDQPTLEEMITFLKARCDILEQININKIDFSKIDCNKIDNKNNVKPIVAHKQTVAFVATDSMCIICSENHLIYNCKKFLKYSTHDRFKEAKRLFLCINCLKPGHFATECKAQECSYCCKRHNTLLHIDYTSKPEPKVSLSSTNAGQSNKNPCIVLLSTVIVLVKDSSGQVKKIRALLDSGSESHFLTKDACNKLNLKIFKSNSSVIGINNVASRIDYQTNVEISSNYSAYKANLPCLVLDKISENIPAVFDASLLNIPANIRLADPDFANSNQIDMLIGASLFWNLMSIGQIQLGKNLPTLQKTKFGWIIAGQLQQPSAQVTRCHLGIKRELEIQSQLTNFWEIEEYPKKKILSVGDKICEEHFTKNVSRDSNGRFCVKIPFKDSTEKLGNSRSSAQKRFFALEKKFEHNVSFYNEYKAFMTDYENLGHMSLDTGSSISNEYFLPHHGVVKTDSQTTKLRVVFDASANTTSGYSLNDLQMVGYKVQQDLLSITMRFRKHKFVVSSDIAKMYRQIQVDSSDADFQKIFWRETVLSNLNVYKLNTVTYGTAAASFLAIRCLYQLAIENSEKYPKAAKAIANDFYVDDLLTGAESVEELADLCEEIINILSTGCFELRKWISNNDSLLNKITSDKDTISDVLKIGGDDAKTLGLFWNSHSDILMYNIKYVKPSQSVTKRVIISNVAKIFDPLGLLGPCIITAKIILQKLWQHKLTWDESVPTDLHFKWCTFQNQMQSLNNVQIPRHVLCERPIVVEMHGYSDSSEDAYGACIYMRSIDADSNITVRLLCAKSRVAPLKCLSIPRLELCGALLLAQLAERVEESMEIEFNKKVFWTDSTIVLCWIKTEPSLLKTFVANRISEIQTLTDVNSWFHVGTKDNPADLLSRGINPQELEHCQMWWEGPSWLSESTDKWPNNEIKIDGELAELKIKVSLVSSIVGEFPLFNRISSLNKLVRVFAYCRRYINNSRIANSRLIGQLSVEELNQSLTELIKLSQGQVFKREIDNLLNNKSVNAKSKLSILCPFLDKEGVIRVGGRLSRADFAYNKMHPIVLPPGHNLTKLIATHEHIRCLHAGAQAVLASLRERYWPIAGRNMVKGVVRKCITCFRVKPSSYNQLMGELPAERLASTRAFANCGVDFAGPLLMKDRRGRGCKSLKVYVCIFVCFAVKAVHLELVTDLSSEAFIAAFRRFAARRGKPTNMYSDNGTNFVGANTEISQLLEFLKNEVVKNEVANALATDGVSWHFIPARSPHFGGLWEAGVKSMKSHFRRVIGLTLLTFEQLYTVLTQIEAVMNSRPLSPMSSDPNDLNPLTPAHFLIGESLMAIPDPSLRHIAENNLSEYQLCQRLTQHFWTRWAKEYVSELQQRYKWKATNHVQLQVGSMVIMKDDNLPPLKWQLGRITQLHPGSDGVVRVVSVRAGNGVVKRAITKICVLPLND